MELNYYDNCFQKEDNKKYKLERIIQTKDGIVRYYKSIPVDNTTIELQNNVDNLNEQMIEQQDINSATLESITEIYELILNEDPIV